MFFGPRSDIIRSRVTLDEINGLEITIPAARRRFLAAFRSLGLIGWAFGELSILGAVTAMGLGMGFGKLGRADLSFMLIFLPFWTVAGGVMMDALAWQFRGREHATIDPNGASLVLRRLGTFFPRRTRFYPLSEVRNLRFAPLNPMVMFPSSFREGLEARLQWFGNVGGNIAFNQPGGTARFGSQLSETEARRLIKTIKEHPKIEDDQDEALPVERL